MQDWVAHSEMTARLRAGMAFLLLSAAVLWCWQALTNSAWASQPGECISRSNGVVVHFLTDFEHGASAIAGLELAGFNPAACDGETITITLSGNEAGDPTVAPTKVLSVLDSSLDPCSGKPASPDVVVADGRISLNACATASTPSAASFADIHDLTRLSVEVAGRDIPIAGAPDFEPPTIEEPNDPDPDDSEPEGSTDTSTDQDGDDNDADVLGVQQFADPPGGVPAVPVDGGMPDTGGPNRLMLWTGLLLVLFGTTSLLWDMGRPRRAGKAD